MQIKHLETAPDVIDALGGNGPTGEITEAEPKTVSMWRAANAFPPKTYLCMMAALTERGFSAPPSLWKMVGALPEAERVAS